MMPAIAVNPAEHLVLDNLIRKELRYGGRFNKEQIRDGLIRAYRDYPELQEIVRNYFRGLGL
jgi:hypothetical protein